MRTSRKNTTLRKLLMLEYYFIHQTNGIESAAKDLNVTYEVLRKLVHEYKKNDCLIVKSKFTL